MQYTKTESNMINDTYYCCWHVENYAVLTVSKVSNLTANFNILRS